MEFRPYLLHALSPLHAGTGHSADVIDLPIARMKATGIPIVPGSSVKGVLRDARDPRNREDRSKAEKADPSWLATFGPDQNNAADHAGSLVVGDARMLALPVHSFKGTFAWVTSPLLLHLANRDLALIKRGLAVPSLASGPNVLARDANLIGHRVGQSNKLFLQDLDIPLSTNERAIKPWCDLLIPEVFGRNAADDIFSRRFAIVDDETMTFLWETATQIDQRVRIDQTTRTVATGALWLEESLPPETLLIGLMEADQSRKDGQPMHAEKVMEFALKGVRDLQFGGKSTVGRGRCRLLPIPNPALGDR